MAAKRRRPSDATVPKNKRSKFTIEPINIPTSTKHGVVLVTGAGDTGQLGLGSDVMEKMRPAMIKMDHEITNIVAGGMHTVCLTTEGKVLTFGCNDEGALGRITAGKEDSEFVPDFVDLPGKVKQISAGDSHTVALLDDGRTFAWGTFRDSHGNMGMTARGNEKLPFEILPEKTVVKVASGADHIVFLTNQGDIYTCGCAEQGQLGRTTERSSGRNARFGMTKLLDPMPITLPPRFNKYFENIWTGSYATFAKASGCDDIYVFGLNNYHQIGLKAVVPQYIPKLSKEFSKHKWNNISSAQHHTIALDDNGKVYAIGRKEYGRLGLGKEEEDATDLKEVPSLKDKKIISIGTGSATSFAVTDEGDLYGWGMGSGGQLGTGEEEDCWEPTLIKSKQLQDKQVFDVSSGGQHSVILATTNNNDKGDHNGV